MYRRDKEPREDLASNYIDLKKIAKSNARLPRALPTSGSLGPFYTLKSEEDRTLQFESRFESGNLALAGKISDNEYKLILQNDTNSNGHTQWFYFRVGNTTEGLRVTFHLLNFGKSDSLFNYGMKVLVLSTLNNQKAGLSWTRACDNISYYANSIRKSEGGKSFYTLTFSYLFQHSQDTVYFAYSYPYTYSDLMEDLNRIETETERAQVVSRGLVCSTILGNRCEHLTVTGFTPERVKPKKKVVISARVHPGETVGSWMMRGALEFLTSQEPEARILRDNYIFKVIPMLNPDGVVNGNYRCGLAGVDLNRRWKTPSSSLHPTIYHTKRLIKEFARDVQTVDLVVDLHGHSRKKNIFMYGCNIPEHPEATRLFPFLLGKISPYFSYADCRFKMQKSKEATMRIALYKELRSPNIYTLEASFCGNDSGPNAGKHFTSLMLQEMGKQLCLTLLVAGNLTVPVSPSSPISTLTSAAALEELKGCEDLLLSGEQDESSDGSDACPSEDNLDEKEIAKLVPAKPAAKTQSSKRQRPTTINVRQSPLTHSKPFKEDVKELPKCGKCGETELPGHQCARQVQKPAIRTTSRLYSKQVGLRTYFNAVGKKVHDQATQTLNSSFGPKGEGKGLRVVEEEQKRGPAIGTSLGADNFARLLTPQRSEEAKSEEAPRRSPMKLPGLGLRTASGKGRPALPYIPTQSGRLGTSMCQGS